MSSWSRCRCAAPGWKMRRPANGQSLWGARSQLALQREEIAALIQGRVDAVYSDAALGALLQAFTGARPVIRIVAQPDSGTGDFGYPTVLTVSGNLLEEHPDLVDRWVARLLEANDWSLAHRQDARRIIAQGIRPAPRTWSRSRHSPRVYGQLDVDLSARLVAVLRQRHDSLLRNGLIQATDRLCRICRCRSPGTGRASARRVAV